MQNLLIMTIFMMAILFMQMTHPLAMGLLLMIQTLLICLFTSYMYNSYWFSYILFLVFMGGMLILFIYVTSLVSNEMFKMSINLMIISMMLIICMILINFLYDSFMINFLFNNQISFNLENKKSLIKLFNSPTNWITILLMNYLLITLIAVVKITNIFFGPLRQMFN